MAGGTSVAILRDIQTLFDIGTVSGLSDRQLLEQFAARRDRASEAASELLVLRHGPMVLRVCRNVLRDATDADDAFQATFLVLVRRIGSIRGMESVGGWLYGVACRVAARARVEAGRRRAAEERAAARIVEAVDPIDGDGPASLGLGPVVQEEVRRLPDKYRAVVALCYWEGLTHEQAAAQLGCPLGTVRSRMARARKLLHRRLTRRGLAPLAGAFATAAGAQASVACRSAAPTVGSELIQSTVRAASQIAAGKATAQAASKVVALLVQQVVWSMTMIKVSSAVTGLVVLGLTGYGIGLAGQGAGEPRAVANAAQVDGNLARQNGGAGRYQPDANGKSAEEKPASTTSAAAGEEKIYVTLEGNNRIISVVPNGSKVKKGDIVCELDASKLKDQLANQKITTESASADWQNATHAREVAEISVIEYLEGIFRNELAEVEEDIKIAEMENSLAEDELKLAIERSKAQMNTRSVVVKRAELSKLRSSANLKKAQNRRRVLLDYTRGRTIKQLEAEVKKAAASALAKKRILDFETVKETGLERQIGAYQIRAPRDGTLVYAPPPPGCEIERGKVVMAFQWLFSNIPTSEAKPESQ
jgi:RNA polymerase sigma factor (sigma-70 family)